MITSSAEQCALFLFFLLLFSTIAAESQTNDSAGRSYVVVEKKGAHATGRGRGHGGAGVQVMRGHNESLSKGERDRWITACRTYGGPKNESRILGLRTTIVEDGGK
ncbi:uncharacterized protein LOC122022709 [Zingiber officinale]|uniref:uncharacterized protein LOC122022709 n=1 Tax=Zingiber officinale TaxID=94328 RepID=UPI001C4A7E11|nr:uncharacterized protein LOC122022709 [Zingiber officinale]